MKLSLNTPDITIARRQASNLCGVCCALAATPVNSRTSTPPHSHNSLTTSVLPQEAAPISLDGPSRRVSSRLYSSTALAGTGRRGATNRILTLSSSTMKKAVLFLMLLLGSASFGTRAQEVAIKTNLLYDAFLNANLGAEVQVAPRWSLDISGDLNVWNLSHDRRWKHWLLQPEARYWFCEPLGGHFVGAHLLGGQYNIGHIDLPFKFLGTNFRSLKDFRHQGWFAGIGIAYGYTWMLHKHWNLEAEIGLGYVFTRYDSFECAGCGRKIESGRNHNYFGPTKAAINLVYVF